MENTITLNNVKYEIIKRETAESNRNEGRLALASTMKENEAILWLSRPNGKCVYMVREIKTERGTFHSDVTKIF